jgi:hypothetical protein
MLLDFVFLFVCQEIAFFRTGPETAGRGWSPGSMGWWIDEREQPSRADWQIHRRQIQS